MYFFFYVRESSSSLLSLRVTCTMQNKRLEVNLQKNQVDIFYACNTTISYRV